MNWLDSGGSETTYGQIITLDSIFSLIYLRNAYLSHYSLPRPHDTDGIFQVTDLKVKVTDNTFRKCTFPNTYWRFQVRHSDGPFESTTRSYIRVTESLEASFRPT